MELDPLKNSKRVFKGVRFNVHTLEPAPGQKREVVVHPGAVLILPLLDPKTVVMIRNERFAVGEILWELPAGTLELNETPIETAMRELEEETGYKANQIEPLFKFYTTPGFCNEQIHVFLAQDLEHVGQKLDESEKIIVEPVKLTGALDMIKSNAIHDGKTIAALLYYHQFS